MEERKDAYVRGKRRTRESLASRAPELKANSDIRSFRYHTFDPFIPIQASNASDTVYYLVHNLCDLRFVGDQTTQDGVGVYGSALLPGFNILTASLRTLEKYWFELNPGRPVPNEALLIQVLANIADISRMLGIYLTAISLYGSRDPDMYTRLRNYDLSTTMSAMQAALSRLPLPSGMAMLYYKYIGLMDISNTRTYTNVGFIMNGSYATFRQLHTNVLGRNAALGYMYSMYPELGEVGPGTTAPMADMLEAFVNANLKAATDRSFTHYTVVAGSSPEQQALASAGALHTVIQAAGTGGLYFGLTRWSVPGSGGVNGAGVLQPSIASPYPLLSMWKPAANGGLGSDAAISAATLPFAGGAAAWVAETIADVELMHNLAYEFNISGSDDPASRGPTHVISGSQTTGAIFTPEANYLPSFPRRRASAGYGLGSLSYNLDANLLAFVEGVLEPGK